MSDPASATAARVASLRSASSKKRAGTAAAAAASAAGATPIDSNPTATTKLQSSPPTPLYEAEELQMHILPPAKAASKTGAATAKGSLRRHPPLSITGPTRWLWLSLMWLRSLWVAYLARLETHPVFTKSMTAAVISVLSDLLAQWLSGTMAPDKSLLHAVDWISVRNQFIIGFFMRGLPVHYWFLALTRMFQKYDGSQPKLVAAAKQSPTAASAPGGSSGGGGGGAPVVVGKCPTWVVVAKVLVDQLTFGPLSNLAYFFVIGWFESRALSLILQRVHKDYAPLMVANWKIWPLVSLVNFKYVPPALQVLFGNVISIFWTTYVVMTTR